MNDLEQRLEELFMSDSRARRVDQVTVGARGGSRLAPFAFVGAVALATLAVILAFSFLRSGDTVPASSPSPSASAAAIASGSPSATPGASASPRATATQSGPASGPKPDASHGLITLTNVRTEADPADLQKPPQFSDVNTGSAAVSPDGKRVAMAVGTDGAQRIITFTTSRPNDVTAVVDFAGTGEVVRKLVWAGDGQNSLLFNAQKESRAPGGGDNLIVEYSTIRGVDLGSRQVTEITRVSGRNISLYPLAWLPGKQLAAAIEILPLGPAGDYLLARGTAVERTPMQDAYAGTLKASRDGSRIVGAFGPAIRWWPTAQPAAAKEILAESKGRVEDAAFRPGTDDLGVRVAAASAGAGAAPPGHFEIWNVSTGKQRVVSPTIGFSRWRADGSAAISGTTLVDPETGATAPLPGGAFNILEVVLF